MFHCWLNAVFLPAVPVGVEAPAYLPAFCLQVWTTLSASSFSFKYSSLLVANLGNALRALGERESGTQRLEQAVRRLATQGK
jgi:hypothetical protein